MKLFVPLTTLVAGVLSGVVNTGPGSICVVHLSDLNYYFYNIQNPKIPIKVPSTNTSAIKSTHFNKSKKTIILVHGSGGNSTGALITTVRDTVFTAKIDVNIIALDWGPIVNGCTNYGFLPVLPQLGQMVANFLNDFIKNNGLKYSDLTVAGHSVAGKFLGKIGEATKGQIQQMAVLDADSVDKKHAKFVEYIKTSSDTIGSWGHANYYPNGGNNQPNCADWKCNHWRVVDLYAESLVSNKFVAKKCDSYANYKAGKCKNNGNGIMGGFHLDTKAQGTFFLYTNGKAPYAKGKN